MKKPHFYSGAVAVIATAAILLYPEREISTRAVESKDKIEANKISPMEELTQQSNYNSAVESAESRSVVKERQKHLNSPSNSGASDELMLPETEEVYDRPPNLSLWKIPNRDAKVEIDGLSAMQFTIDLDLLKTLHVGQVMELELPHGNGVIEAEITRTYNDSGGVQVWNGRVENEFRHTGVIITQGRKQTHIVIASSEGNYSALIDNQSGITTLIDESAINERQKLFDDGIVYRPTESEKEGDLH